MNLKVLSTFQKYLFKMSKSPLERIISNAEEAENMISYLREEIKLLTNEYNKMRIAKIIEENIKLENEVEVAKKKLIALETKNGLKNIPIVLSSTVVNKTKLTESFQNGNKEFEKVKEEDIFNDKIVGQIGEQKNKKEKKSKEKPVPPPELPVDFGYLDLRVGKVENVERHPDADSLYLLKINCGEDKPRTVCSGLVKQVPIEQLQDINVIVLCNLKPVKMRGITSEAMVMCACSSETVEVLSPPPGVLPGDLVECGGYTRQPVPVMNPKKKIFETVAPDLHTNDALQACYKGQPWHIIGKGNIVAKTLKNVNVK